MMPVGRVQVEVLELCRRGQDEIGIVGGVGLKMFEDDGEQVVAS